MTSDIYKNNLLFTRYFMLFSLLICANECYILYMFDFAYECVRIRIRKCAIIGVSALTVAITTYLARLIEIRFPDPLIREAQEESEHRQRQCRPLKNSQDANSNNDELFQSKDLAKASNDNDNYDHALDAQ